MKNLRHLVSAVILISISAIGLSAQTQRQTNRVSTAQVGNILRRLEQSSNRFRGSLNTALISAHINETRSQNDINSFEPAFLTSIEQFRNRFNRRIAVAADAENILQKASPVDGFMVRNRLSQQVQNDWASVKTDLNALANVYGVSWQWNNQTTGNSSRSSRLSNNSNARLTGTFRLDPSRSDNPRDVVERATQNLSNNERQGVNGRMLARLESPDMLAIERLGSTITMASSRARQASFEANGVERQEQLSNGRSSRLTATLQGDQLVVRSTGYRENDFNATFESIENGSRLRVTREIFSDRLTQPVVVHSIYDRTSDAAQWNIYDGSRPTLGNTGSNSSEFILRDGDTVVAVLNDELTTQQAKQGDRFSLTVREPRQYDGAIIEGTVGNVDQGGRLTGRSGMSLNFDTIRLSNGQTYKFAGTLASVRSLNGDTVKVDNEGSAQGDNQTTQTVTRAGIGTAIGAIIGAVAGGGKGAAIGGIIGAAGGAGSVYVTGKDSLELPRGTELTIRAGAPR